MSRAIQTFQKNIFLFQELVKRDFQKKYKGTLLGVAWSVISPLLTLLIMRIIFTEFFGRDTPHYTIYLFSGNVIMSYYKEATRGGMKSLLQNASVLTKINIPKYLFLLSKNVSSVINFFFTLLVYFLFCAIDGIPFTLKMLTLVFPTVCVIILCIGVGMILSCMYVFFRDTTYLYDVFLTLLTYLSAIFYTINRFPASWQKLFLLNPVYDIITYFRSVVIDGIIPSAGFHLLCFCYPLLFVAIGAWLYKKLDHQFIYYF